MQIAAGLLFRMRAAIVSRNELAPRDYLNIRGSNIALVCTYARVCVYRCVGMLETSEIGERRKTSKRELARDVYFFQRVFVSF